MGRPVSRPRWRVRGTQGNVPFLAPAASPLPTWAESRNISPDLDKVQLRYAQTGNLVKSHLATFRGFTLIFLSLINCKKLCRFLLRPIILLDLHSEGTDQVTPYGGKKKKCFHDTFAIYLCIDTSEKPAHASVETVSLYLRSLSKCRRFHRQFVTATLRFRTFLGVTVKQLLSSKESTACKFSSKHR